MVGRVLQHARLELDLAESEGPRGSRLGHRHVGRMGTRGALGQRTAIKRLQLERELIGIDPIAALEHLVQTGGCGVVAGRVGLIAVLKLRSPGINDFPIQLQLGGQRQMLAVFAAYAHRDLERIHTLVVGDAGFSVCRGGHDLAHFVCERLADISLRERDAVHLRHFARDAIGTRSVGEAAVGNRQAIIGLGGGNRAFLIHAVDTEGELIGCHVAAVQRLLDGNAGELRLLLVLVHEVRRPVVVAHLGDQLAAVVIGHLDRDLVDMTIEHDAAGCGARFIKILAAVLTLLHRERIRAGLVERHLAKGERGLLTRLRALHHSFGSTLRDNDSAGVYGVLRSLIGRAQLEAERLAFRHIAAGQHLGAMNRRIALELGGVGFVRVFEAEHAASNRLFAIVLVVLGAQFKRAANIRDGHLRGPHRLVVHHASRVEGLVRKDVLHGTPRIADFDHLDDLVLEGRRGLPGRNIVKRERRRRPCDAAACLDRGQGAIPHLAVPLVIDAHHAFALGQRRISIVRAGDHVEHVRLKRVLARCIRIRLCAAGGPLRHIAIVLVLERCRLNGLRLLIFHAIVACQLRHLGLHRQLAVVVFIGYRHDDLVQRLRCAHAGPQLAEFLGFPNLIRVRARLRIVDALKMEAHRNAILGDFARYRNARLALAVTQSVGRRHRRLNGRIGVLQDEHERIGQPIATGQHLLALKLCLAIQRAGCGVRVLVRYRARFPSSDLTLRAGGLCLEAIARRLAHLIVPACGKPVHVQGLARLQGMLRLAVLAERQHEPIALLLAVRVLHHGVEALADGILHHDGELEGIVGEIIRVVPIGQLQLLRHRQRTGLIDAQLAVIAQISVDLRLRSRLPDAAPLRVQHVCGSRRAVLFLDLVQLVDVGQTRRAGLEIAGTRGILADSAFDLLGGIAGEGHVLGLRDGLAVLYGVVVVLVVVGRAALHRLRGRGACLIGVDGRVLREVIVAVARCRLERGDRVARFLAGPLVGVEVHLARCVGVVRHIRLHGVIGVLQQIECRRLHAGGVQHRDRRGVRDAHGVLRQIDGEVAQRDQGCGHLHLHLVAHRSIVRTRDFDHDVLQVGSGQTGMHGAAEMVRVDVPVRGLGLAAVHRSVVHELGQVGDLHVIAQLIIEGDIARPALVAFACLRGIAGALDDLLGDIVEHALQLIGVFRALIVCGTIRAIAEVPLIPIPGLRIRRRRVVARHGVHKLVLVGCAASHRIDRGIRAIEDADGIHRSTRILHGFGVPNSIRGDAWRELPEIRRGAVGEEHDDLLGIGTPGRHARRKAHALIGPCCTGGPNGPYLIFELLFGSSGARSQLLHHLAVIVLEPAAPIRVVADLVGPLAGELHDGNLMLLSLVLDRRVLLGYLIDEQVRRALERVDALRFIAAAHLIVHRPGGIEHQHDVERRGFRIGQVRRGRQRRERGQKVRTVLLGYGDAVLADFIVRHGLVGPDTPDA